MRTVSAGAVDAADVALEQEGEPGINLHLAGVRINAGPKITLIFLSKTPAAALL